jgi:hypothetical protein
MKNHTTNKNHTKSSDQSQPTREKSSRTLTQLTNLSPAKTHISHTTLSPAPSHHMFSNPPLSSHSKPQEKKKTRQLPLYTENTRPPSPFRTSSSATQRAAARVEKARSSTRPARGYVDLSSYTPNTTNPANPAYPTNREKPLAHPLATRILD